MFASPKVARRRLREVADAYAPDRPDRSIFGDVTVAVIAVLYVVLVGGIPGIWWVLTGKGKAPEER